MSESICRARRACGSLIATRRRSNLPWPRGMIEVQRQTLARPHRILKIGFSMASFPRRTFLKTSVVASAGAATPYWFSRSESLAGQTDAKNDRPVIGSIGVGGRGSGISRNASRFGDVVAFADVDRGRGEAANQRISGGKADLYGDYRKLLERDDIDFVTIGTPDHWHTKICLEALAAGKDVYCEKPLTLTIDEGKKICDMVKATGRVFQVGTQQRSEMGNRFLLAVALAHSGRLGKIHHVSAAIGGAPKQGPFQKTAPPANLDWDMWLGQAPMVDYIRERTHGTFRWWYEYSGGKMTDWGAHHVDIAQWAIQMDQSGPLSVEPVAVTHPVPFENGHPTQDNAFNTATAFLVKCKFPGDITMSIRHDTDNGVLIEGDQGRIFVSRGRITGKPVEQLADDPLPEDALTKLRRGKPLSSHMANFVECCRDRSLPVSDVYTHHRALTTCHLANIAMRVNRPINWDAATEQIVGDDHANGFLSRPQRAGYEVDAEVKATV